NGLPPTALGAADGQGARVRRASPRLLHARGPGANPGRERPGDLEISSRSLKMRLIRSLSLAMLLGSSLAAGSLGPTIARAGWQEHRIRQGDGRGGWLTRPARRQVLKHPDSHFTMPFGLVRIGNGEIAVLCRRV